MTYNIFTNHKTIQQHCYQYGSIKHLVNKRKYINTICTKCNKFEYLNYVCKSCVKVTVQEKTQRKPKAKNQPRRTKGQ